MSLQQSVHRERTTSHFGVRILQHIISQVSYLYLWRHSPGTGWAGIAAFIGFTAQAKPARFESAGASPLSIQGMQGIGVCSAAVCCQHSHLLDNFVGQSTAQPCFIEPLAPTCCLWGPTSSNRCDMPFYYFTSLMSLIKPLVPAQ